MTSSIEDDPIPLGVLASSGRPLNRLTNETIELMLEQPLESTQDAAALAHRAKPVGESFGVIGGVDEADLKQAGWAVIYGPSVSRKIKEALKPLLDRRQAVAGNLFKIFDGKDGYWPGDTAESWLSRHRLVLDVVDPEEGLPFYVLIIAPPEEIPFEFQYSLDIYWAVGRLWFDTPDEFRQYAASVLAYEDDQSISSSRTAVMFATQHDFDLATELFTTQVAIPIAAEDSPTDSIWKRRGFGLRTFFGAAATKTAIGDILKGGHGTPALLFTGSHGMEFGLDDPRQSGCQGAIVCQDWEGFGKITEDHWFSSFDVPEQASLMGMIHILFCCHGGGCPSFDNYERLSGEPKRIALQPFLARLPQKMLAHPDGGALACLAHVDRAWAYRFQDDTQRSQVQGFRDILVRLMLGERIGQATDTFNLKWAASSTRLAEMHADISNNGKIMMPTLLAKLWIARDDARNYVILGDPAVRLRIEDMPQTSFP